MLGSAAAVVVLIALALGLALNDPVNRSEGPVDHPKQDNAPDETPMPPVRKLLYSEGACSSMSRGSSISATGTSGPSTRPCTWT